MHPNPAFRTTPDAQSLAFARERGFGTLALNAEGGPLLAHVPFLLDDTGEGADLHLVRSNPILRLLDHPQEAVIAVQGPDGYVSPDWYGAPDQVPTWNYVAVHLRGTLAPLAGDRLRDVLDRLSAHFEQMLTPKTPWHSDKMSDGLMERMMRQIAPCRLTITAVDSTWKLGQNKPDAARRNAAAQMAAQGIGQDTALLAALMDSPPPKA
ncbi:FMN-binding negative transcriptional regulator [Oceaniglobus trochenteri]|uniref:FMN-binding negative transcriptional regulator n=1 Tax=Oceaniglobus trochenteri TaxID=2763260 RepID=UPI001CFF6CE5|nr:FMN-binding negative transcriptional regulator [Oceaniglobus trochenteri]